MGITRQAATRPFKTIAFQVRNITISVYEPVVGQEANYAAEREHSLIVNYLAAETTGCP